MRKTVAECRYHYHSTITDKTVGCYTITRFSDYNGKVGLIFNWEFCVERFVFHRSSSGFLMDRITRHQRRRRRRKRRRCGPVIVARTRCGRCIFNRGKHEKWKHVCYPKNAGCKSKLDAIYLLYMVNTTLERTGAWFFLPSLFLFHLHIHHLRLLQCSNLPSQINIKT